MQRFFLLLFSMKHSIIVGFGLAGLAFAEQLKRSNLSFSIIDSGSGGSSQIAAGIYNPTVLKRFSLAWNADVFHQHAMPFYSDLESKLKTQIVYPAQIHKIFNKRSEHNEWISASDTKKLAPFLDPKIHSNHDDSINATLGYGNVMSSGRVATNHLINSYKSFLSADEFIEEEFDFKKLKYSDSSITYKDIQAKHIVFCEGFKMINNPFFKNLPLVGSKGEILIIKAPKLKSKAILKGPIFITPIGGDLYWAGATFERNDKTLRCTPEGREWVLNRINKMISTEIEVIEHITQIRPTVQDRRPLLGTHPAYKNIHLLNGLGSRGVLAAPLLSEWLLDYIEGKSMLNSEVDISRFESYLRQTD